MAALGGRVVAVVCPLSATRHLANSGVRRFIDALPLSFSQCGPQGGSSPFFPDPVTAGIWSRTRERNGRDLASGSPSWSIADRGQRRLRLLSDRLLAWGDFRA